ncbi:MAG: hypothetical protein BWY83_02457 [bacterium ADurb.Bin478]|nr:MAG: hypothetical protein BWY83_02457 [bacterium ADurb.Bin478]
MQRIIEFSQPLIGCTFAACFQFSHSTQAVIKIDAAMRQRLMQIVEMAPVFSRFDAAVENRRLPWPTIQVSGRGFADGDQRAAPGDIAFQRGDLLIREIHHVGQNDRRITGELNGIQAALVDMIKGNLLIGQKPVQRINLAKVVDVQVIVLIVKKGQGHTAGRRVIFIQICVC